MPAETYESISFREAGACFEVHRVEPKGDFLVLVTDEHGHEHSFVEDGFTQACDGIDRWLDENVSPTDPRRFGGYRLTVFDHEDRIVRERAYPTRGALLKWFDDGHTASLDDVVELAEFTGDHLILLKDNDGNVLMDRREMVRDRLAEIYKDSGHASVLADLGDYEVFGDIPVPGR